MIVDPADLAKAIAYNNAQSDAGEFTEAMVVALVAHWQATHGLVADGCCGPATQSSLQTAMGDAVAAPSEAPWPPFDGPLVTVPKDRYEVYETFGNPGAGAVDGAWERTNIVTTRNLPGVPSKWYFQCHRLVEPYLREGLRRAQLAAPTYQIARAASFVFRHQRHDPKRPLSYHAWGIAVDIDPDLNYSKTFAAHMTPGPFTASWRRIWPKGLPEPFVVALESVGFVWGGRWRGFVDPMHFEFVGSTATV